jgi:homogentisate phytyltransferase/homogentisate geranylgeranyltransferase
MSQTDTIKQTGIYGNPIQAFWQFTRPHTIIGTLISLSSLFFIAKSVGGSTVSGVILPELSQLSLLAAAIFVCLGANIYIVGLNQITDIDIDKINKKYLPLASGDFSLSTAWIIVGLLEIFALIGSFFLGNYLFGAVALSSLLGTLYSLPPFRLKRFPIVAAAFILIVRGIIVNLVIYSHFEQILNGTARVSHEAIALCVFMLLMAIVIAIYKDIPDTVGDKKYNISTFAIRFGRGKISLLSVGLLASGYTAVVALNFFWLTRPNLWILLFGHGICLSALLWRGFALPADSNEDDETHRAFTGFYQFIWKLFHFEYILFALACVIGR